MAPNNPTEHRTADFFALSNKLIDLVIGHSYYQDLVHLAITCHMMHKLAGKALQHYQVLLREISSLTSYKKTREFCKVIVKVIKEPWLALYIRKLAVWDWEYGWDFYFLEEEVKVKWIVQELKTGCIGKVFEDILTKKLEYINQPDVSAKEAKLKRISNGDKEPIIGFLLVLAQNLVNLKLVLKHPLSALVEQILVRAKSSSFLSNLKLVTILSSVDTMTYGFFVLMKAAIIPSVEKLIGEGCNSNGFGAWDAFPSNVQYLDLKQCAINDQAVLHLIHNIKLLERFTYSHQEEIVAGLHSRPRTSAICKALLNMSVDTLEVLEITGFGENFPSKNTYMENLRSLASLRDVTIDFAVLFKVGPDKIASYNLTEELPSAIYKLSIDCKVCPGVISDFLDLLVCQPESLPSDLESLEVRGLIRDNVDKLKDIGYDN